MWSFDMQPNMPSLRCDDHNLPTGETNWSFCNGGERLCQPYVSARRANGLWWRLLFFLNNNTLPTTIKHLHFQSAAHEVGHLSSDEVDMRGRDREGQGVGVLTKSNLAFDWVEERGWLIRFVYLKGDKEYPNI